MKGKSPLGNARYFSRSHIGRHRKDAPAVLAEQAVHCLELVAELSRAGLDFTFKGGNSLLLLLSDPRRFSIDVDITTREKREKIGRCIDSILAKHRVFSRVRHRQHKTKPWLPMTSYELFYPSHFTESGENFVMLDVMFTPSAYPTFRKRAACKDLYRSNALVRLPRVSSLIGDKLLTLGPHTLGIPLGRNKEAQRLKHAHDVSLLADHRPGLPEIRKAVRACMAQENELQEKSLSLEAVAKDTFRFCALPASFPDEPLDDGLDPALSEIVRGREPFAGHLFARDYSWERLNLDLAKAALCMAAVYAEDVAQEEFLKTLALDDAGCFWKKISLWLGRDPLAI
jgi:hypothetical protein